MPDDEILSDRFFSTFGSQLTWLKLSPLNHTSVQAYLDLIGGTCPVLNDLTITMNARFTSLRIPALPTVSRLSLRIRLFNEFDIGRYAKRIVDTLANIRANLISLKTLHLLDEDTKYIFIVIASTRDGRLLEVMDGSGIVLEDYNGAVDNPRNPDSCSQRLRYTLHCIA